MTKSSLAKTDDEAVKIAKEIGFPVVMKIVSPDILHKSDAGGVKVNIRRTRRPCARGFQTIMDNAKKYKADADIHGVLVCEMAPLGSEVIVGSVNDATFGPTVMFGLGGIFVEVLKDVTFRVAPFSLDCALAMLPEIKGYPILQGVRGEKRLDQEALASVRHPPEPAGLRPRRRDRRDRRQPDHALRRGQGLKGRRRPHHPEEEVAARATQGLHAAPGCFARRRFSFCVERSVFLLDCPGRLAAA